MEWLNKAKGFFFGQQDEQQGPAAAESSKRKADQKQGWSRGGAPPPPGSTRVVKKAVPPPEPVLLEAEALKRKAGIQVCVLCVLGLHVFAYAHTHTHTHLQPTHTPHTHTQGLTWYAHSQKQDTHGDIAVEFLEEGSSTSQLLPQQVRSCSLLLACIKSGGVGGKLCVLRLRRETGAQKQQTNTMCVGSLPNSQVKPAPLLAVREVQHGNVVLMKAKKVKASS